jgi:two-component system LytT family response regulator
MLRTILIDDEPGSLATLEQLVRRFCPEVDIIGLYNNPHEGVENIVTLAPDLLLLDIEMPELSGFDILEKIRGIVSPKIVFTTAHNEYAVKAFKYAALHFLHKPVDGAELREAIERCKQQEYAQQNHALLDLLLNNHRNHATDSPTLALPTQDGYVFVKPNEIVRCEADGGYTKFYLKGKETVIVSHTLGNYEDILADYRCYRVHDKHIVNLNFVKKYLRGDGGTVVLADNSVVEVSRRRREGFLKKMQEG